MAFLTIGRVIGVNFECVDVFAWPESIVYGNKGFLT